MLFRLNDVSKSYGAQEVLRAISFQLNPGEHAGLVGPNGAGKTTILRLIEGRESPDTGSIERLRGLRIGVLSQQVDFSGEQTVISATLEVFADLKALEDRMRELEHAMTETQGSDLESVLEEYSEAQHAFEHAGGFSLHARAEAVLFGLGFAKSDLDRQASTLSGGEKNRLGLARLLLAEPDLLLLDEPTNHLDVDAVEWLEEFLSGYKSAFLLVSHDRFFLDHTVARIIELDNRRIEEYRGNYSSYLEQREERRQAREQAFVVQQELIARTEDFIRRNLAGQKTKQAKSRRNMLERLERVDAVASGESANFKLKPAARSGDRVLTLDRLEIGYPSKVFASDFSLLLRRGERLGVIGGNGTGKTTFLRTIIGKLEPLKGEYHWGTGVNIGYYDQQLRMVDDRHTVLEELRSLAPASITDGELRGFLGRFLFSGDDAFKQVASLSGGEKGRLALAKLIYSRVNVLVLDEPTNHLDIASCEALEAALNENDSTIITVSHDRYFLDRIATRILFFEGNRVEQFEGGYSDFYKVRHQSVDAKVEQLPDKRTRPSKTEARRPSKASAKKRPDASDVEAEILKCEEEMRVLTESLVMPEVARDWERLQALNEDYQQLETRLAELFELWEAAQRSESSLDNDQA
jgi:ATP-binding cassette, subfamily F, member 3